MDHLPFIIAAYTVSAVVLAWCALAPRFALRRTIAQLSKRSAP